MEAGGGWGKEGEKKLYLFCVSWGRWSIDVANVKPLAQDQECYVYELIMNPRPMPWRIHLSLVRAAYVHTSFIFSTPPPPGHASQWSGNQTDTGLTPDVFPSWRPTRAQDLNASTGATSVSRARVPGSEFFVTKVPTSVDVMSTWCEHTALRSRHVINSEIVHCEEISKAKIWM